MEERLNRYTAKKVRMHVLHRLNDMPNQHVVLFTDFLVSEILFDVYSLFIVVQILTAWVLTHAVLLHLKAVHYAAQP